MINPKNHPLVIYIDEWLDRVFYLNNNENLIDTTTIYQMENDEFLNTFHIQPQKLLLENHFLNLNLLEQKQILNMMLENEEKDKICLKEISNNTSTTIDTKNSVRLTIMDAVIDWNERNHFHNYHPQYFDIKPYQDKWFKPQHHLKHRNGVFFILSYSNQMKDWIWYNINIERKT